MSMIKKSISITDQQNEWIKSQIASGHYGNESEVLRDLIRKEQSRNSALEAVRTALIQGEQSGIGKRSAEEIKRAVILRKTDGQL